MNIFAEGSVLQYLLAGVVFILSIFIIVIVLIQKEKGGGLSGAFGGSGSTATFGVKTSEVVEKVTWGLFVLFVICSFGMAISTSKTAEAKKTASKETDKKEESKDATSKDNKKEDEKSDDSKKEQPK